MTSTSDELRCWADHLRNWVVNASAPKLRAELLRLADQFDAEAVALDARSRKRAKPRVEHAGFPPSVW
jgi:hypothetical protein